MGVYLMLMIKIFVAWYIIGLISIVFWSYKANKKWGVGVFPLILANLGFFLLVSIFGPLASIPGYIGYEIGKME